MKVFLILLVIVLIFVIPIPIKISIYYSKIDYYMKLYKIIIISKKKIKHKIKPSKGGESAIRKEHKIFADLYGNIDIKSLIRYLYNSQSIFKPVLKIKFSLDFSLNDAARTAIFYGALYQIPTLIYILMKIPFKISKFNFKINPIFEDEFLLKFEISSIIFLSFANIIYIIISLFKFNNKAKEVTP